MSFAFTVGCLAIAVLCLCQSTVQRAPLGDEADLRSRATRDISSRAGLDDGLIYPEDDEDGAPLRAGFGGNVLPDPSPCPEGETYCESAEDYPTQLIKTKLKKESKLILGHFYVEEEPEVVHTDKFDHPEDEVELCASFSKVVYPKKAQSTEGFFEFVVNDEENKQGVRVESCGGNSKECSIPGSLSNGYTSHCVQKYIRRTLVVLNKNSSAVEGFLSKPFEFPSCCSCVISMHSNRFGGVGSHLGTSPAATSAPARKTSIRKN